MKSDPRTAPNPDPQRRACLRPRSRVPPPPPDAGSAQGESHSCGRRTSARRSAPTGASGSLARPGRAPLAPRAGGCRAHRAWGSPPAAPVRVCKTSSPAPLSAGPALRRGVLRIRQWSLRPRRGFPCSSARSESRRAAARLHRAPRRVFARRSIGLVESCHSLCAGRSSICAVAVRPVSTSRPGVGSS